jgi:membrane protein
MTLRIWLDLLKQSFQDWNEDDAPRLGASLAFYTILSVSPLAILVLAIASLALSRSTAQAHLLAQVQATAGAEGREAVRSMLISGQKEFSGVIATSIGVVTLLFGASGVFGELRSALNTIWECKPKASSGVLEWMRERFFSLGMVISVGFVLLTSLLASTALDALTKYFAGLLPIPAIIIEVFNFVVSFLGISVLFGLILKYVPETKVDWVDVRLGSLVTALLFTIGKSLLGIYLGKASPGSAYGAAGSLVVMVIWVFGAEFTHVHALWERGLSTSNRTSIREDEEPAARSR